VSICLAIAVSSVVLARLSDPVTLAWEHTVEKIRIEEDYRTSGGVLVLSQVRTTGVGAGIEVPPSAEFIDGRWHFAPALPALPQVLLANSRSPSGYIVCQRGRCAPLRDLIGDDDRVLALVPCPR
jgi:hypothetical protein